MGSEIDPCRHERERLLRPRAARPNIPTKLLIGQILVVLAIVTAGVWAATQWAAAMLVYQPQLCLPWLTLFDRPVYLPWAIFPWWYHYDAYVPYVFDKAGALAAVSGFVGRIRRINDLPILDGTSAYGVFSVLLSKG